MLKFSTYLALLFIPVSAALALTYFQHGSPVWGAWFVFMTVLNFRTGTRGLKIIEKLEAEKKAANAPR